MEEPFQQYDIFINNQGENITREKLKTYFDNIVDVMNALEDHDVYIQYVDTVATNLLNIDVDQLNKIIILDHPLILDLRNLTIELLQKQNYVYIKLITLFTNFYSKINKDILSKLHILFFHQPLLDALVHHRKNEEFADITDQFLTHLIQVHKTRFCSASLLDQTGVYLDEGVTYLCSSAYIDTFNHLFTRLGTSDENKLDSVEEFYLVICPSYVRLSGGNDRYMQASSMILEKMFRVYVNILTEFTKIIKKCSQAIIKSVTWLMNLLQCVSVFHEIRHKFINTSQDLIGVMWDIIFELSLQSEPYTHSLLDCTIGQMFCTTFEVELLPKIKQIDMIPTLLKLIDDGKPETIQFQSYRLLSVVMAEDEIQNQLTDAKKIIKIFFSDLSHSLGHALFKFRLENILFCLKSNV